ncbi:N-acetylmuramoyl-L-alanine amidase [Massilia sp. CCM 8734]|uniref:peptidoglycan recognition protein family protein n=1 Tax=Massilia sp. CCM 8734 TaxID=2609283 RepID=UPI0014223C11|nr:N-acetylmuramoyl-L-alanine amidase [Massilia sp. CCM 8734]
MLIVNDGIITSNSVTLMLFPLLEHGPMKDVSGIILHQTSRDNVITTMAGYRFKPSGVGAHFLINPAGQIFQTARITQVCYHVGRLNAYCQHVHRCTPRDEEVLNGIAKMYPNDESERWKQIDEWEQKKAAALRFPANHDSIGIEVVGAPKNRVYGSPTSSQNASVRWLVSELLITLKLDRKRIFPHGLIDPRKFLTEGSKIAY